MMTDLAPLPPAGGNVYCYLRRSTTGQAASLDTQRSVIEDWSAGRFSLRFFADSVSGSVDVSATLSGDTVVLSWSLSQRPGLRALLGAPRPDAVAVVRRDRMARSVIGNRSLEMLLCPVALISVQSAGSGRVMRTIEDAFSEHELTHITERTREGVRAAQNKKRRTGNPRIGTGINQDLRPGREPVDGELQPRPGEQAVVVEVLRLALLGWGDRRIAGALNELRLTDPTYAPRGKKWWPTTVGRIRAAATAPAAVTATHSIKPEEDNE